MQIIFLIEIEFKTENLRIKYFENHINRNRIKSIQLYRVSKYIVEL